MGQMGTQNDPGHPENEWEWLSRRLGVLRGSNSVHDLISDIYRRHSDTVYCSQKGGRQRSNGWSKSFFLENKVVINYDFRHAAKKSGQLGHPHFSGLTMFWPRPEKVVQKKKSAFVQTIKGGNVILGDFLG